MGVARVEDITNPCVDGDLDLDFGGLSASTAKPSVVTKALQKRDPLRERWKARVPWWYSPGFHLLSNAAIVFVTIGVLIEALGESMVRPWAWLAVPGGLIFGNLVEYLLHRHPMHKRMWFLKTTFRQHTLHHHRFYTYDNMDIQSRRDLYFVVFQSELLFAILGITAAAFFALKYTLGLDVAVITGVTFVVFYMLLEYVHLISHLPDAWFDYPILRSRFIRFLRVHHRVHHDLKYMRAYNFTISFPLFDWVCGTIISGQEHAKKEGAVTEPANS